MKFLTRTVWILSVISLLTDVASEMLYPVMPVYLKSIGFSIAMIGVLEGIAEATAGLSKGYFGKLSDHMGRRLPFVQLGYSLSAISKPMMALFIYPLWIFLARTLDRIGKGLRTGPRDAMLSSETSPTTIGSVFGFHRSMDTLGAVLGPALALVFLYLYPGQYKTLFLIAFVPGLLAIVLTLLLKEKKSSSKNGKGPVSFFSFLQYWKRSAAPYRRVVTGFLIFSVGNSSDVFLLLRMKETGLSDTAIIATYIFYNLVFALFALPLGILADRIGLKKIYISGLFLFVCVYTGMSIHGNVYYYAMLFFIYGVYAAATEGISKAWISSIASKSETATAIGMYTGIQSICGMMASFITGFIWYSFGATAAFLFSASLTGVVIIYLAGIPYIKPVNMK